MGSAIAELRFVTQSENRAAALAVIYESAPIETRELESRLDASRRTVIRVVNSLEERGYLRKTGEGIRLTPFGTHVATQVDRVTASTETAVEFRELLRHAPPALADIPVESLAGAELLVASDADPFSILDRVLTLRAEATRIREVAPSVQKESIDQLAERVREEDDLDVEAVISRQASDAAEDNLDYSDGHATTVESSAVDIYVHPEELSFFAGVMDETAAIGVSKDGQPYALAVSDDPDLHEAVTAVYERFRAEATLKSSE